MVHCCGTNHTGHLGVWPKPPEKVEATVSKEMGWQRLLLKFYNHRNGPSYGWEHSSWEARQTAEADGAGGANQTLAYGSSMYPACHRLARYEEVLVTSRVCKFSVTIFTEVSSIGISIRWETLQRKLMNFSGDAHRLLPLTEWRGY